MTRTVLIAVDGTPPSEAAVEYGAETFPDSDLRLLHVVDPYGVGYDTDGRDPERLLAEARETAAERGVDVETVTAIEGDRTRRPTPSSGTSTRPTSTTSSSAATAGREPPGSSSGASRRRPRGGRRRR